MNYLQFVNTILETSKSHKLVYEVGEGDIYEHLNSGDHKYPCVFLTVQNVDSNGPQMTVTGSIFYVDALLSDSSNKLQIQATGMTTLQQIFMRLMDNYQDFDLRTGRYTPFDEKFADLCAGVFSNFTISFMDDICIVNDDIFEGDEPITPEPEGKYLTITGDASNKRETIIRPNVTGNLPNLNLQYRINSSGAWTDFIVGETDDIHLFAGDWVQFKGNNQEGVSIDLNNYLNFSISDLCHLSGNVMSLIDGVGDTKVIPRSYCFNYLFKNTKIKTVAEDLLPATTLAVGCYYQMLIGCTALENAPALPATTLSESCYDGMFFGCTALENAPELPATTLTTSCYYRMFKECTALENAPALPATTLSESCYGNMFAGCTLLKNAPELHSTTLADNCYSSMFYGCTSLTTAPALPATTLAESCYSYMFFGCTSITTAPALPATTIDNYCYGYMFYGCTSLTTAPELPATTLAFGCYEYMFKNCNNLNYVQCRATEITATNALTEWLYGVSSTGTFVKKYGVEYLTNSPSGIPHGWTVEEIDAPIQPEGKYLTITCDDEVEGEAVIEPKIYGSLPNLNLQYRINNGDWMDFIVGTTTDIHLTGGNFVQFKGLNPEGISNYTKYPANYLNFSISGNPVSLSGNVMSLIDGVGDTLKIPNEYCFYYLFYNSSSIKTVSSDFLPATELKDYCYQYMFYRCTALTTAPELPATTLANRCYLSMFYGCTSLTTAPALPATTLTELCYNSMFKECTALTTAPALPATTLTKWCYISMFQGCTSLTTAPALPATTLADSCYSGMFNGCTSLTTAPALPATTLADSCYNGMFNGCTSLVNAPSSLPATTLAEGCYSGMFNGCTSLTTAPELPATTLSQNCYENMFKGCSKLVNAPALPATTLANRCYYRMFQGCSSLVNAHALPATTLAESCYYYMFQGCTSLVNAPSLPATTLSTYCYYSMFSGCTSLVTAPVLPATTLSTYCYQYMFSGCNSLVNAPALPATTLADRCYQYMFDGCTSLTTAPVLPATTLANYCYDGMFFGCTSLTTAPVLPATTLANDCYFNMFNGCTALTTAPELPATVIDEYCYGSMFFRCTALTTAPELPATTLAPYCYNSMFKGCTSLTQAPVLPATTLVKGCYSGMFNECKNLNYIKCIATDITTASSSLNSWLEGVSSSGTFVKTAGVEYPKGSSGIPEGWTVEEIDAPIPPEPTGKYMTITVDGNAGKTIIKPTVTGSLPNLNLQYRINNGDWTDFIVGTTADIIVMAGDFVQWKGNNPDGVSTSYNDYLTFAISGNPVALSGNIMSLIDGVGETLEVPNELCFYYLFYNSAIKTVSSDFLPATTLKGECYRSLFAYCNKLTQAPALPATTLAPFCYSEMFGGCSALKQAPELPATTLVDSCYNYMFIYCSSLNSVKCLATDNISTSTIFGWLSGVSSTGTFVKPAGVSYETGESGIPEGWTIQNI